MGDLEAVESGLEIEGIAKNQERGIYRFPDNYPNPSKTLEKLTDGKYQKISGSRAIGPRLNLENVRSKSFHAFINGLKKLL